MRSQRVILHRSGRSHARSVHMAARCEQNIIKINTDDSEESLIFSVAVQKIKLKSYAGTSRRVETLILKVSARD